MRSPADPLTLALRDAAVTRAVDVAAGALARTPEVLRTALGEGPLLVVSDENTERAAGTDVVGALDAAGAKLAEPLRLPGNPRLKPRVNAAEDIAARLRETGATPVAVGSGVINDLVKYAAALAGRPYACVATAASMDGYAASGAALMNGDFKQTMACPPPLAVIADLDVLAGAPSRMAAWGYGDLAGKIVAGADWALADALGVEPIAPRAYAMVQEPLAGWLAHPERLGAGEPEALGRLVSGLFVTGFAMQAHGNSRPASGSDHQFSHLWEMEGLTVDGEPAAHGACVGIGCIAMLALYEWLVAHPPGPAEIARARALRPDADHDARELAQAFGNSPLADAAAAEVRAKRDLGPPAARLDHLAAAWPDLRARFAALPSPARMQQMLAAAGGASHPSDLGISHARLAADYRRARLIRRRYTLLDLLEDLGWLDRALADLFGPRGFWGAQAGAMRSSGAQA